MSLLKEFINSLNDSIQRESIQERIDIVEHKIKFRDTVPVYIHDCTLRNLEMLNELVQKAGGSLVSEPSSAKCLIYYSEEQRMVDLMNVAMQQVQADWESAQLKQVYLVKNGANDEATIIDIFESIAEIIHPGFFVFGMEGDLWIRLDVVN